MTTTALFQHGGRHNQGIVGGRSSPGCFLSKQVIKNKQEQEQEQEQVGQHPTQSCTVLLKCNLPCIVHMQFLPRLRKRLKKLNVRRLYYTRSTYSYYIYGKYILSTTHNAIEKTNRSFAQKGVGGGEGYAAATHSRGHTRRDACHTRSHNASVQRQGKDTSTVCIHDMHPTHPRISMKTLHSSFTSLGTCCFPSIAGQYYAGNCYSSDHDGRSASSHKVYFTSPNLLPSNC